MAFIHEWNETAHPFNWNSNVGGEDHGEVSTRRFQTTCSGRVGFPILICYERYSGSRCQTSHVGAIGVELRIPQAFAMGVSKSSPRRDPPGSPGWSRGLAFLGRAISTMGLFGTVIVTRRGGSPMESIEAFGLASCPQAAPDFVVFPWTRAG